VTENTETNQHASAAVERYLDGFNKRDANIMADGFNFPHVRLAKGQFVSIPDAQTFINTQAQVTELLRAEGWDHMTKESMSIVQSGPGKVHLAVHMVRRNSSGQPIHDFNSLWIVTEHEDHWGVQFRSSFLTSSAATLANLSK
jgi:hypothetical protein